MKAAVPQLILDFEPPVGSRDDDVNLLIFHSEQEYFDRKRSPVPEYKVSLPRPFQATALMPSDTGRWKDHPRDAGPAQALGKQMWMNLPDSVQESILGGTKSVPQRVAIMTTHCGMDDVPWEWLTGDNDRPIATMDTARFIRVVPARYALPPLSVTLP